jgi:hypothetical protein
VSVWMNGALNIGVHDVSPRAVGCIVHSVTGYWIRLPVRDVSWLLLAARVRGARIPAAAGRIRPARVLVGEMGRPHRTADDTVVVAAAIPGHLTSHHQLAGPGSSPRQPADRPDREPPGDPISATAVTEYDPNGER